MSLYLKSALLLIVLIMLGGAGLLISNRPALNNDADLSEKVNNDAGVEKALMDIPESWLEYRSVVGSYSVRYPATLELIKDNDNTIRLIAPESQSMVGDTNFAYVSIVPNDKKVSVGEYYNYNANQVNKLINIGVGEEINLSELEGQKDWFLYKRLADITLGDSVAKGFENTRPWEFPIGTIELYYLIQTDNFTYIVGGYTRDDAELARSALEMIIASFRIIGT